MNIREFKDTNIQWLGKVPAHWQVMPNKYIMTKIKEICPIYKDELILSLSQKGVITRDLDNPSGKMPKSFNGYQRVKKGNLLMCLFDIDVTPRCIGLIENNGLCSPAYSHFKLNAFANSKYYYYYYLNLDFKKTLLHLAKNLRHSLTEDELGRIQTLVPPLHEQTAIANFLDVKCAEIDALAKDIENQITILQKIKKSTYSKFTLQNNSKWETSKIKYLLEERSERSVTGEEVSLSMSQKQGLIPSSEMEYIPLQAKSKIGAKIVKNGDLVFNKLKAHLGVFSTSHHDGIVSPDYAVYKTTGRVDIQFLEYLFKTHEYIMEFNKRATGVAAGLTRLYTKDLFSIKCKIPTLSESINIVATIKNQLIQIEKIIEIKESQIQTLNKLKQSLVYEYVTGKKTVPNA